MYHAAFAICFLLIASNLSAQEKKDADTLASKKSVSEYLWRSGIEFEKVADSALYLGSFCCLYNLEERRLGRGYSAITRELEKRNIQDSLLTAWMEKSRHYQKESSKDILVGAGILVFGATAVGLANATIMRNANEDEELTINFVAMSAVLGGSIVKCVQGSKKTNMSLSYLKRSVTRINLNLFASCCGQPGNHAEN